MQQTSPFSRMMPRRRLLPALQPSALFIKNLSTSVIQHGHGLAVMLVAFAPCLLEDTRQPGKRQQTVIATFYGHMPRSTCSNCASPYSMQHRRALQVPQAAQLMASAWSLRWNVQFAQGMLRCRKTCRCQPYHGLLGRNLQGVDAAHDLVHVSTHAGRVVEGQLELLVWADDEDGTDGEGQTLHILHGRVQHAIPANTSASSMSTLLLPSILLVKQVSRASSWYCLRPED